MPKADSDGELGGAGAGLLIRGYRAEVWVPPVCLALRPYLIVIGQTSRIAHRTSDVASYHHRWTPSCGKTCGVMIPAQRCWFLSSFDCSIGSSCNPIRCINPRHLQCGRREGMMATQPEKTWIGCPFVVRPRANVM
ncbi:hypothetical protein P171DRAFT_55471 [Karstenula rhodostoma CBS 690.94]|uniref:Uncharacterized protein n=1 Tax=Karstenula rhodostoma CBS 690.94 TaxID=1392251 RepID=A0A9P4PDJ4_9PLEO|nr:hypothetical protein P171DRAFT_55471 [Karstenula rhodostoma CBS 690.94]